MNLPQVCNLAELWHQFVASCLAVVIGFSCLLQVACCKFCSSCNTVFTDSTASDSNFSTSIKRGAKLYTGNKTQDIHR
jgi:hypothetical protein